jgi:ribose transport system permease protein
MVDRLRLNIAIVSIIGVAAAVFGLSMLVVDGFATSASVRNIAIGTVILGIVGAGQTIVIIGGGIDLSVPWVMTGAGLITPLLVGDGGQQALVWVLPVVLLGAALVGVLNGLGVTVLGAPPIIMTLAMNGMLSGAVTLYASSQSPQSEAPQLLKDAVFGTVAGIPAWALILLVVLVAISVLLSLAAYGRRLYAVGTSPIVSRYSGIESSRVIVASYALSSVCAGFAGMMLLGYVDTGYYGMGDPYQFASIACVLVGGASVLGGSGHYVGTLAAAFLLTTVTAILTIHGVGSGAQAIFYGATILGSAWLLGSGHIARRSGALLTSRLRRSGVV